MVRVRLRVNGDARSGVWIRVGSGTDYPNIHRLREAIGVTLFSDPSYGLNIDSESIWAAVAIEFYMNGDDKIEDLSMVEKDDVLYVEARGRPFIPPESLLSPPLKRGRLPGSRTGTTCPGVGGGVSGTG